jgi:hypothetical protein
MKEIRRWARLLHRDLGFFFVGTSLIYGFSGIALNHIKDWNPNYSVVYFEKKIEQDFNLKDSADVFVTQLLNSLDQEENYKTYAYLPNERLKIYLAGGSSVTVNITERSAQVELLQRRWFFYQVNFLHYNPHVWWKWFSDIFAGALIFFALSALIMVRGHKGFIGRGGIYVALGILIPLLLLLFF